MTTLLTENKFSDAYETKIAQFIHYVLPKVISITEIKTK